MIQLNAQHGIFVVKMFLKTGLNESLKGKMQFSTRCSFKPQSLISSPYCAKFVKLDLSYYKKLFAFVT